MAFGHMAAKQLLTHQKDQAAKCNTSYDDEILME